MVLCDKNDGKEEAGNRLSTHSTCSKKFLRASHGLNFNSLKNYDRRMSGKKTSKCLELSPSVDSEPWNKTLASVQTLASTFSNAS